LRSSIPAPHPHPRPHPHPLLLAAAAALVSCSCSANPTTSPVVRIDAPTAAPSASERPAAAVAHSCPDDAKARAIDLYNVKPVGNVADITYATAERQNGTADTPLLTWLDAKGDLAVHPIARTPFFTAGSGATLHLLGLTADRSAMFVETIDVSNPDAPRRRSDDKLPISWDSVGAFAADTARIWITELIATGNKGEFVTFIIDRATNHVEKRRDFAIAEGSFCDGAACTVHALDHTAKTSSITRYPHTGDPPETIPLPTYPGYYASRADGAGLSVFTAPTDTGWLAVTAGPSAPHLALHPHIAAPPQMCSFHAQVPGPWPGVVACKDDLRTFVHYDPDTRAFTAEPLPPAAHTQELYAAFVDGPIHVAWTGGSFMMHGPDFNGMHEYHHHWTFDGGEAGLLARERGRWLYRDVVPLPLAGANGDLTDGYSVAVLVRGPRAAVVLTTESFGDPSQLLPLRKPCH
jgi:hypothetical protein